MRTTYLSTDSWGSVPLHLCHTLVVGSGAAGLNAALQARRKGLKDVVIVTEGLGAGTSINTGSDKQTYYKLGLCGETPDSPLAMAADLAGGGAMHGDLALAEAAGSARAFLNLVELGVPFPRDRYGQFVGYQTDHDSRRRATSTGPYTSRDMCRALIAELRRLRLPIHEGRIAVALLTLPDKTSGTAGRCAGLLTLDTAGRPAIYLAEHTLLAVGGPGGIYRDSVYPAGHTGAIGLALEAGALARNLPESQHGLASLRPRWNVSGSYLQAVPRLVSLSPDGTLEPFLPQAFGSDAAAADRLFLKGYQWPFQSARALDGGSSLIDLLVWRETIVRGRRVFLDYRDNPDGWDPARLCTEARDYLTRCGATQVTPCERLRQINPGAIVRFADEGIDLATEPVEIAVCFQHNNGGLAANVWWESENLAHLYPIGEVNGSHGLSRPGGSALNSGQVGGQRAAEYLAARGTGWTLDRRAARAAARAKLETLARWLAAGNSGTASHWRIERGTLQARMSRVGALLRDAATLQEAIGEAREQMARLDRRGCRWDGAGERAEALRTRMLCLTHQVYLEAIAFAVAQGVGSRGSALVLGAGGTPLAAGLGAWRPLPEDPAFRDRVQLTRWTPEGGVYNAWEPCRPIPESDTWFETAWAAYREGRIFDAPE